jgi:hypothetical protein
VAQLDQALGALDRQLGDGRVVVGRPVEGRGDDLALDRALHVGDLLGALVDEHDHEVASGLFLVIALAIACRMSVLPAFGGLTMRPRWPLPIGRRGR